MEIVSINSSKATMIAVIYRWLLVASIDLMNRLNAREPKCIQRIKNGKETVPQLERNRRIPFLSYFH